MKFVRGVVGVEEKVFSIKQTQTKEQHASSSSHHHQIHQFNKWFQKSISKNI